MPAAPFRQALEDVVTQLAGATAEANRNGGPRKNQLNTIINATVSNINDVLEQGRGSGQ